MKSKLFLLGLLTMLLSLETMAQSSEIVITKTNKFLPPTYTRCDIALNKEQLLNIMKNDNSMSNIYNSMNLNYAIDALLSASAGALVLWPVTQKIQKKEPNWNLVIIGAGCFTLSIPFKIGFHKKAVEAVEHYNSGRAKEESVNFNFQLNENGIGLVMNF